ncbi:hypothetical protein PR202_ga24400 [Eleusine coracana subsp. coracana]|uniref:Uncharacterized protein n=1 Tax=Eleusine coracana subsp. coracana TaxID=191504 RepID=A0AAV5D875_ELECO|nr:hypothetical protein PR202_ga24400 [Eleusine coracana subsp. coracana]
MARVLLRRADPLRRLLRPPPHIASASLSSSSAALGCCNKPFSHMVQLRSLSTEGREKSKSDKDGYGEEGVQPKDFALQQALDQITSAFGKESIMWLHRSHDRKEVPVISKGSFALDLALGIGGLPKGRVVEIYGPEASGKTTLALHVIAEAQKSGGYCAFIDAEHALDPALAESIGVNAGRMLLSQPDCAEQALGLADILIRSGSIEVVVVDSAYESSTSQVESFTFSLKDNVGVYQSGLPFVSIIDQVKIVKNKHAPPFRTVQLELEFGKGLSRELEIIELGCEHKLITKSGVFYHINGQTFQGKDAIKHYLTENRDVQEDLMAMIREKINEKESQLDKNEDMNPDTSSSEQIVSATDEEVHGELEA